ncbi:MAG: NAD(P)-dependent oxidoreductase, partial [Deltaproteobacteria bacterium]|nr:NAD(P)-dependent oxidoreductase [Deltaproteobacteria bacterium]
MKNQKSKLSSFRVGVVGIGRMGKPITNHLSRASFDVCFYDTNPKARVGGAKRMNSCKELTGRADVNLVIVGTDSQVK